MLLKKTADFIDTANGRIGEAVNWILFVMIAVAVYNALGRYLGRFIGINLSSNFFLELQWYLFSLVFLFGASSALLKKAHVSVDVFASKFSEDLAAKISLAGGILLLLPFCLFIIVISIPSVKSSWAVLETSPDPGGIVRYPIKTLVPVAFFLLFLQGISGLARAWLFLKWGIRGESRAEGEGRI